MSIATLLMSFELRVFFNFIYIFATAVNQGHKEESLPDIRTRIEKQTDHWEEQQNYMNVNGEEICNGYKKSASGIQISGTSFRGNCYLMAEETIQYSVDSLNRDGGKVVLYTENGDICISGSDIVINGILAAPNGNARINANRVTINGRIYARGVEMSGTSFHLKASEKDMELLGEGDTEEKKKIIKIYDSEEEYAEGTTKEVETGGGNLKLSEQEAPVQKVSKKYNENVADGVTAEVTLATDSTSGGRKLDWAQVLVYNMVQDIRNSADEEAAVRGRENGNKYPMHTNENMVIGLFKETMLKIILEPEEKRRLKKLEELQKEMEHYVLPIRELPGKEEEKIFPINIKTIKRIVFKIPIIHLRGRLWALFIFI